ncbi:lysophospholipase-like protein A [Phaeosphaeriaceae sp. PMI808]|nr:lysophospholipase-like protein A [Phaeosphaeriaceae sp. PMI808]
MVSTSTIFLFFTTAVVAALFQDGLQLQKNVFNWKTTKSVIAFGDSYTYVQGSLGHTNYTYMGDNFNISFTPEKLFSNRIVLNQTWVNEGTASGGSNWVEFLTGCGIEKGFTDPKTCNIQLWDFAYAGANTVSEVGFTPAHSNHSVSFEQQIDQFVGYGNPALQSIGVRKEDALIAIWIGINDINDLTRLRGKNETLHHSMKRSPSPALNTSLINTFNNIAATYAEDFQSNHRDATVLQFDINTLLNEILDKHEAYGFKNTTGVCPGYNQADIRANPQKYGCGEGLDTYFWYDAGHLGSHTHKTFTGMLRKWLIRRSWA